MARTVYQNITGMDSMTAVLQALPREMRANLLAAGVDAAAEPVVKLAKAYAKSSRRTGALVESISHRVKKYPTSAKALAVIGPARGYYRGGKVLAKGSDRRGSDNPANYAHLVEFGHHVVAPKKNTTRRKGTAVKAKSGAIWVPGKPFLRPAMLSGRSAAEAAMQKALSSGIERVRAQMIKEGSHKA